VGIVGGIGSGKSAVANWVAAHANVMVLNADHLGHEAMKSQSVKEALCQRFGNSIIKPDGTVDRSMIAQRVFGSDPARLAARSDLERIIHPEIGRRVLDGIEAAERSHRDAVLLDAAVLLESGWRDKCDLVAFIDTSDSIRLARVRENRGWSEEELKRRESSQWSLTEKRREADLIVMNDDQIDTAGQQLLDGLVERGVIRGDLKR
jgi:dephospho-CoA kinase